MIPTRYPLTWPAGWPRASQLQLRDAKFSKNKQDLSVFDGVQRVLTALKALAVDEQDVIISTNIRTRLDGLPRSGEPVPVDRGAAIYWEQDGHNRSMAIDIYTAVADNLAAIAATLEAIRAIERHGGGQILERVFTGFAALPAPEESRWWDVLMVSRDATEPVVTEAWKRLRSRWHPDKTDGHAGRFDIINKAYQEFKESA